jgi:hypothetical protein
MITGFFLTDADEEVLRGSRIKKMLFKTLRLTFIIQVFYLALKWVSMPPAQVASFYTSMRHADYWVHFLLIGDNFCGPLWYLHALIECLIVLYVVAQQHQVRLIWILGGIGFLLNMALASSRLYGIRSILTSTYIAMHSPLGCLPLPVVCGYVNTGLHGFAVCLNTADFG